MRHPHATHHYGQRVLRVEVGIKGVGRLAAVDSLMKVENIMMINLLTRAPDVGALKVAGGGVLGRSIMCSAVE